MHGAFKKFKIYGRLPEVNEYIDSRKSRLTTKKIQKKTSALFTMPGRKNRLQNVIDII